MTILSRPVEESGHLAATIPGTEFLLITAEGGRVASPGWGQYQATQPTVTAAAKPAPPPSPAPQPADAGMELIGRIPDTWLPDICCIPSGSSTSRKVIGYALRP